MSIINNEEISKSTDKKQSKSFCSILKEDSIIKSAVIICIVSFIIILIAYIYAESVSNKNFLIIIETILSPEILVVWFALLGWIFIQIRFEKDKSHEKQEQLINNRRRIDRKILEEIWSAQNEIRMNIMNLKGVIWNTMDGYRRIHPRIYKRLGDYVQKEVWEIGVETKTFNNVKNDFSVECIEQIIFSDTYLCGVKNVQSYKKAIITIIGEIKEIIQMGNRGSLSQWMMAKLMYEDLYYLLDCFASELILNDLDYHYQNHVSNTPDNEDGKGINEFKEEREAELMLKEELITRYMIRDIEEVFKFIEIESAKMDGFQLRVFTSFVEIFEGEVITP